MQYEQLVRNPKSRCKFRWVFQNSTNIPVNSGELPVKPTNIPVNSGELLVKPTQTAVREGCRTLAWTSKRMVRPLVTGWRWCRYLWNPWSKGFTAVCGVSGCSSSGTKLVLPFFSKLICNWCSFPPQQNKHPRKLERMRERARGFVRGNGQPM